MAVSVCARGGLRRFSFAAATTCGICRIRAMALATFFSFGRVDCVSSGIDAVVDVAVVDPRIVLERMQVLGGPKRGGQMVA